jgi:hypothetical protein
MSLLQGKVGCDAVPEIARRCDYVRLLTMKAVERCKSFLSLNSFPGTHFQSGSEPEWEYAVLPNGIDNCLEEWLKSVSKLRCDIWYAFVRDNTYYLTYA